jgi:polyketide synthase PksN
VERGWEEYGLHPSLLDGVLQVCVGLLGEESPAGRSVLPYALERLRVVRGCAQRMWAWVRVAQAGAGVGGAAGSEARGALRKLDVDLCDEQGQVCVQLRGFVGR